jgi:hypothetical protein
VLCTAALLCPMAPKRARSLAHVRDCAPRFARASLLTNNNKQQNEYDRDALDRATRQDPSRLRSSRFKDEQMERNRRVPKAPYDDR